jgi:hypothetical protein
MADREQKVCDGCHMRPAVHHIRYGRTGHTRHSCQVCFEQFPSPEELAFAYAGHPSQRDETRVANVR